jgi:hypothetical protein
MSVQLEKGMRVSALRMSNKAVILTGTIVQINDDGKSLDMTVDGHDTHVETVHVNDVAVLDAPKPTIEELEKILNSEDTQKVVINKDGSVSALTTVNGKPI